MPIRLSALFAVVLSACGFQSDPAPDAAPALSTTEQPISCSDWNAICDPADSSANGDCEQACGGSGHCMDYSPAEIAWCAAHPDRFYDPHKYCGPSGDPLWQTRCVPGPTP